MFPLLQLPHELIYMIALVDRSVYNVLIRLCRRIADYFTLSVRLDYMISAGVTVRIGLYLSKHEQVIEWYLHERLHDVIGPARVWSNSVSWYRMNIQHRDPSAPAAIGYEPFRGYSTIVCSESSVNVFWVNDHEDRITEFTDAISLTAAQMEIDYWRAQ
jgi:hypothetical protein